MCLPLGRIAIAQVDFHQNCGDLNILPLEVSGGSEERAGIQQSQASLGPLKAFLANDILTVFLPKGKVGMVRLIDLSGKECYKQWVGGNEETLQISTSTLPSGLYFISFDRERKYNAKIVIAH